MNAQHEADAMPNSSPWMSTGPQTYPEQHTKTFGGQSMLRDCGGVGPVEGAEPAKMPLPDAPFKAVDQDLITPMPGQAQVSCQLIPAQ